MCGAASGRRSNFTILNHIGHQETREMKDFRGRAAFSSEVPRDPVFPSFPFVFCKIQLSSKADLPWGPRKRICPRGRPKSPSDWTNPGHMPTPEPITVARGRVCTDWPGLSHLLEPGHTASFCRTTQTTRLLWRTGAVGSGEGEGVLGGKGTVVP